MDTESPPEKWHKTGMNVTDAVLARHSVRAFLEKPVAEDAIREIVALGARAPSGGNLQPWKVHVVTGAARRRLIETVRRAIAESPLAEEAEIRVYPERLWDPYRTRRYAVGEAMYALLETPREDKAGRIAHLMRNFEFFGAPAGLFFSLDRRFDRPQWAHLGMFMQTIALLAVERGLGTCMQEAWATRAKTVSAFLGLPAEDQLYCGMALGHPDPDAPVNRLRAERAPAPEFLTFLKD